MTFGGWQEQVQKESALPIYKELWDGCVVVENDSLGETEKAARILDFGDVDKIIRISGLQIHMAQRFRKPYFSNYNDEWVDPDFTLRYSRPTTDNTIEYERLMEAASNGAVAYPKRYSFGRVHNDHEKGLYELYILDVDELIEQIQSGSVEEDGPIKTNEGQEFMAYDIDELIASGIVVKSWSENETTKPDKNGQTGLCDYE